MGLTLYPTTVKGRQVYVGRGINPLPTTVKGRQEVLAADSNLGNPNYRFVVAVVLIADRVTVGHLPRNPSHLFRHFLTHGGTRQCEVMGSKGWDLLGDNIFARKGGGGVLVFVSD